jgi:hypothetical protein
MSAAARSGASVVVALAVACLPLLPPQHIHPAGIEGRTIPLVHAHPVDGPGIGAGTGASDSFRSGHGNHAFAIFPGADYSAMSRFVPQPGALVSAPVMIAGVFRSVGVVFAGVVQTAHGPPRSAWLARGPPHLS